jgi:hypothetical protein
VRLSAENFLVKPLGPTTGASCSTSSREAAADRDSGNSGESPGDIASRHGRGGGSASSSTSWRSADQDDSPAVGGRGQARARGPGDPRNRIVRTSRSSGVLLLQTSSIPNLRTRARSSGAVGRRKDSSSSPMWTLFLDEIGEIPLGQVSCSVRCGSEEFEGRRNPDRSRCRVVAAHPGPRREAQPTISRDLFYRERGRQLLLPASAGDPAGALHQFASYATVLGSQDAQRLSATTGRATCATGNVIERAWCSRGRDRNDDLPPSGGHPGRTVGQADPGPPCELGREAILDLGVVDGAPRELRRARHRPGRSVSVKEYSGWPSRPAAGGVRGGRPRRSTAEVGGRFSGSRMGLFQDEVTTW